VGVTDGPDTMKEREIKHRFPGHLDSSLVTISIELCHLNLVSKSRMMELHLHSSAFLRGIVPNGIA
jgi:hypothetical protein